ncbi:hypothetical protein BGW42_008120 [Actinomortierella wolfii]|nr:hypothetical protein BGW42_008120 [Actinomortierella wolfii]
MVSMNRAAPLQEMRPLKYERLTVFLVPEIFQVILDNLPLASLISCSLVCRQWHTVVQDFITYHPTVDSSIVQPFVLECDPLYTDHDQVKPTASRLRSHLLQSPAGKIAIKVVTSKRYLRLRYWETYAAACHSLASELALLREAENGGRKVAHGTDKDSAEQSEGDENSHLRQPDTCTPSEVSTTSKPSQMLVSGESNSIRHLTLLDFGFMELLSPVPLIRLLGAEPTLTSLTIRMSEYISQHPDYSFSFQQRSVSAAELFFTLCSLPNLVHLEIESTHRLEETVDKDIYYYLGRDFNHMNNDGFLLPDVPRRPHGLEQMVTQYNEQWLSFLAATSGNYGRLNDVRFKLRRLRLVDVEFNEHHMIPILARCPHLEELVMDGVYFPPSEELMTTLRKYCPNFHTLRLLRVNREHRTLCADVLRELPTLKTLVTDEHDMELIEYNEFLTQVRNQRDAGGHDAATGDDPDNGNNDDDNDDGDDDDNGDSPNSEDDDGLLEEVEGISLRQRRMAIRFYWRRFLEANMITRLVLIPTAEISRNMGGPRVHTDYCKQGIAFDLNNFLRLAPHLLHLEAPATVLFEDMIIPKRPQHLYSQHHHQEAHSTMTTLTTEEHVARLLKRKKAPTSWVCHKLRTLQLSIWSENATDSLDGCDTSAIFGFLARTCPDLEHISLRRKALSLHEGHGFGLEELAQMKRLRVLELSVNSLLAFNVTDVAWIFERKKNKSNPPISQSPPQHQQCQQQPTLFEQQPQQQQQEEEGGLHGRAMGLFRINYKTLLGSEVIADSQEVNKAFGFPFAFSIHKQ